MEDLFEDLDDTNLINVLKLPHTRMTDCVCTISVFKCSCLRHLITVY